AGHPKGRGLVKKVSQLTTTATPILILRRDGRRRRPSRRRKGLGKVVVSSVAWFTNPDEPGGVRFDRNTTQSWNKCRSKNYFDVVRFHDLRADQSHPRKLSLTLFVKWTNKTAYKAILSIHRTYSRGIRGILARGRP